MNITKTLIICIVALFQTVTLSNAAVHTSVAPRSNPQDYSSVPTSTTNYITQPSCFDKLNNCGGYGNDACLGIFHYWALENCQRHCEMCNTTFPKGCYDKEPTICSSEADTICTNTAYKAYVEVNCQKTCYQCSGHIRTTPTPKGCSYKGVHYQHNAQWKDGCKKCTCINGLYNCVEICPQYQWPNWPLGKSTRGCCPSHVIGVGDPVCNYGGKEYKQDETWSDGCQFSCVCNDGKAGQYQCKEKCPKWDLPDVCHWNPAPPGKCCRQPECPLPYVITGYPDY
ncbi:BMP-binding endothelial regulator protein-like isoform X2 [Mytilus galloprovincialis]|uniref:BMP-binding endothelial regulator protein-like isoform X2 n=1 Tax=Mytilus galloprovincialis TaxID=29158 RepID=UPI003F7BA259